MHQESQIWARAATSGSPPGTCRASARWLLEGPGDHLQGPPAPLLCLRLLQERPRE